jgi:hypothetical protein
MGANASNGIATLKIAEKSVHSIDTVVNGQCDTKDTPSRVSVTLEYRDGHYMIPKGMRHTS